MCETVNEIRNFVGTKKIDFAVDDYTAVNRFVVRALLFSLYYVVTIPGAPGAVYKQKIFLMTGAGPTISPARKTFDSERKLVSLPSWKIKLQPYDMDKVNTAGGGEQIDTAI